MAAQAGPVAVRLTGFKRSLAGTDINVLFEVISFDWNCPRYITPRYTTAEVEEAVEALRQRIAELEAQLKVRN
jgi:uncharacterized protein (UPF0305 family)